jgi:hypothetical protein
MYIYIHMYIRSLQSVVIEYIQVHYRPSRSLSSDERLALNVRSLPTARSVAKGRMLRMAAVAELHADFS